MSECVLFWNRLRAETTADMEHQTVEITVFERSVNLAESISGGKLCLAVESDAGRPLPVATM